MGRKSNAKKQKNHEMSVFEYLLKLGFMYGGAGHSHFRVSNIDGFNFQTIERRALASNAENAEHNKTFEIDLNER